MDKEQGKNRLTFFETETIGRLMMKFSIPAIISMIVNSVYNIVDQIFIGQGVGYLGNAATNVAYPLSTICLSYGLLIGVGSASNFSLKLGAGKKEEACQIIANGAFYLIAGGLLLTLVVLCFLDPMLRAFGATYLGYRTQEEIDRDSEVIDYHLYNIAMKCD